MLLTSEQLLKELFPFDSLGARLINLQIFGFQDVPQTMSGRCFPIVDKTLGLIMFANGGHRLIVKKLGRLHWEAEQSPSVQKFDDEYIEHFLKFHGYYWTMAESPRTKLVTVKDFKFTAKDKQIAALCRLSMMDPDFPFD